MEDTLENVKAGVKLGRVKLDHWGGGKLDQGSEGEKCTLHSTPATLTQASPKFACALPGAWVSGTNISLVRTRP